MNTIKMGSSKISPKPRMKMVVKLTNLDHRYDCFQFLGTIPEKKFDPHRQGKQIAEKCPCIEQQTGENDKKGKRQSFHPERFPHGPPEHGHNPRHQSIESGEERQLHMCEKRLCYRKKIQLSAQDDPGLPAASGERGKK